MLPLRSSQGTYHIMGHVTYVLCLHLHGGVDPCRIALASYKYKGMDMDSSGRTCKVDINYAE